MTEQLESPDRLARFWDHNWKQIGHTFTDIPDSYFLERDGLHIELDTNSSIGEYLLRANPMRRVHITVPRKPFAWVMRGWRTGPGVLTVSAESIDDSLRRCVTSEEWFVRYGLEGVK